MNLSSGELCIASSRRESGGGKARGGEESEVEKFSANRSRPATMKSRSRSRKRIKRKKRREKGGDGRKKRMKKRERERKRKGRNGARIERALYSDKMILSIVNAAVGFAGL